MSDYRNELADEGGAIDDHQSSPHIAAMQTRAKSSANIAGSGPRPLKVTKVEDLDINFEQFKELQQKDKTMAKYWEIAKENNEGDRMKAQFIVEWELLYKIYRAGPDSDKVKQVASSLV